MIILWQTPSPSSGFLDGPAFKLLPQRVCVISFRSEGLDGKFDEYELHFTNVCSVRVTFMYALTEEMILSSYDKLVEVEQSSWLASTRLVREDGKEIPTVHHLRITFDDGPCYEFLCASFDVKVRKD